MNQCGHFWLLSNSAIFYAINVLTSASLTCTAGLLAAKALRWRSVPLRYGVLQAALLTIVASPGLVFVAQQIGTGWVAVEVPDATELTPRGESSAGDSPPWRSSVPVDGLAAESAAGDFAARTVRVPWLRLFASLLATMWGAGVLWHAGRLVWGAVRVAQFRRTWVEREDDEVLQAADRAAAIVGLKETPRVLFSRAAPTPLVAGLWRPVIVLPYDLCGDISAEQLQALLVHESAHIAHRDQWTGVLQRLAGLVFWPLPLVQMVNRRLSAVREDICDNYVLRACGTGRGLAEVLVQLAERLAASPPLPATVGLFETAEDGLPARIERLLLDTEERNTMTRMNLVSLLAAAVFAGVLCSAVLAGNVRPVGTGIAEENPLAKLPVLGQDRKAVIAVCGEPTEQRILISGIQWMHFHQVGEFRLIVEISPVTNKVIQVYHFRKAPFTEVEIREVLARNAEGRTWRGAGALKDWVRSDGAMTRGGYDETRKQHSFTVLSPPPWR